MIRTSHTLLVFCGLAVAFPARLEADTIQAASGETITGRESTIVDGAIVVPAADGKPEQRFNLADLERLTFTPAKPLGELKTKYVRIDQPGSGKPLTLAEVEVMEGDQKIARNGKARQSVTYMDDDEKWGAQKAIDGKTGGDSTTDGVTRTLPSGNPWWELELPAEAAIKKLVVWLRTDAQPNTKMSGFRVQFLNARRQVLWTKTWTGVGANVVEVEPPVHSDKLSADDVKAIEGIGTSTGVPPLTGIVEAWMRDVPPPQQANANANAPPAAATGRRLGGFSAEAPRQQTGAVTPSAPFPEGEWLVRFEPDGFVVGKLASWNDKGLTVEFTIEQGTKSITIPTGAIIEVSSKDVVLRKQAIDRTQIAAEGDTVFAKAEGNAVQAVTGAVKGIDGDSLQFEFQGKVRGIKLARVASLMRKKPAPSAEGRAIAVVHLANGMRVPGQPKSLSTTAAVLELPWDQPFELTRSSITSFSVLNGRAVPLTTLEPSHVEYTPFLDRVHPYRKNESLTGSPLAIGDMKFTRGLCAHSGTVLTYDLAGAYEKLRLQVGMQKDDGARGQAVVRFKGDDAVLLEKPVAGTSSAEAVEVDVKGKKSLVIEIDYADGLDVGDHVVLAEPTLVRTAAP